MVIGMVSDLRALLFDINHVGIRWCVWQLVLPVLHPLHWEITSVVSPLLFVLQSPPVNCIPTMHGISDQILY